MDTIVMRVELHDYINHADEKEIELLYTMWSNTVLYKYEWWEDEELVAELDKRSAALESGEDKGKTWEEVREHLIKRIKRVKGSAQITVSLNNLLLKYIFKSFLTAVQLNICPCHLVLQLMVAR